jgi:hypothetical protein
VTARDLDCEGRPEPLQVLALLEASEQGMTVDELARRFREPDDFSTRKQRASTVLQGLASRSHARVAGQVPDAVHQLVNLWVITQDGRDRLYRELLGRPVPVPPKRTYLPRAKELDLSQVLA